MFSTTTNIDIQVRYSVREKNWNLILCSALQIEFPSVTVCNQNRIKCTNLEVRMNECSNGTATNCSNLKELETIWNMTQCGRKILSEKGADSGASDGITVSSEDNVLTGNDNEGSSVSGSGVLSRNNAEEESSDESCSETATTASRTNTGSGIGRKKRQVLGSNIQRGFGFSSLGSLGSNILRSQPAAVDAEYEFLAIYMSLPESERKAIGHDFEGMFKSCIFEGVDCLDPR